MTYFKKEKISPPERTILKSFDTIVDLWKKMLKIWKNSLSKIVLDIFPEPKNR
jgi:hypothetical protein